LESGKDKARIPTFAAPMATGTFPSCRWSHDGKYFYFDKFRETDPAIFRLRLSDHTLEKVVSLKNVPRAWGSLGWWMGLAPDDAPVVLRDTSIEEIYALDLERR
jgi:hypothetical protein